LILLKIIYRNSFVKDVKKAKKRGKDLVIFERTGTHPDLFK